MYRHPIIVAMVSQLWFSDSKESDGVFASESFNLDGTGIPFETILLVLTAVYHIGFGNYTDLVNEYTSDLEHHGRIQRWCLQIHQFYHKAIRRQVQCLPCSCKGNPAVLRRSLSLARENPK